MKRNLIIGFILIAMLTAGGFWLYDYVLGDPLEASAPIAATPLQLEEQSSTSTPEFQTPVAAEAESQADLPAETPTSESRATDGLVLLAIVPEESEARFKIYELLNGQDKDVIGTTSQVAGQVAINPEDLSQVQLGPIQINARTLVTDDGKRNNAIRNRILNTDQYEFITFTPKEVIGLSGAGELGKTYTFQIIGDLTIRDITQPVTFDVTLQAESETRLKGFASARIKRSDFNLVIPNVPFVANVSDELTLELDFVLAPAADV